MSDETTGETGEQEAHGSLTPRRRSDDDDYVTFLLLKVYEQNGRILERIRMTQQSIEAIKNDLAQVRTDLDRITAAVQGSLTTISQLQAVNTDLQTKVNNLQADAALGDQALNDLKQAADEAVTKADEVAAQLEGAINPPVPASKK